MYYIYSQVAQVEAFSCSVQCTQIRVYFLIPLSGHINTYRERSCLTFPGDGYRLFPGKLPQPEFPEMEAEQKEGVSVWFIFFFFFVLSCMCPTIFKTAKSRISFPYLIWETRPLCLARVIGIGMDVFAQRKWISSLRATVRSRILKAKKTQPRCRCCI